MTTAPGLARNPLREIFEVGLKVAAEPGTNHLVNRVEQHSVSAKALPREYLAPNAVLSLGEPRTEIQRVKLDPRGSISSAYHPAGTSADTSSPNLKSRTLLTGMALGMRMLRLMYGLPSRLSVLLSLASTSTSCPLSELLPSASC